MTLPDPSADQALRIYLALAQYPILRTRIRELMRRELFRRGIITPQAFEAEVRAKAIESQAREGLHDPLWEENEETWEMRLSRIRTHLTDFYFAYNLHFEDFENIVKQVLAERDPTARQIEVSFNPELAPQEMLFEQAQAIEHLPSDERKKYQHRYNELIVVLIRKIISDQLAYINIAKSWFTISDLQNIRRRKIGHGKIGGKAAGMLLAARILSEIAEEDICQRIRIPESYFLGSEVMYAFMSYNDLMHWADQKYKSEEQIHADYPRIQEEYARGEFPPDILERLHQMLEKIGPKPLIVRSSSLLEDNFGTSFAGKYDSVFCPNQGDLETNLHALTQAIAHVFASGLNPDALLYRRAMGLQDYDERLAILIQVVEGEQFGDYYFPHAAGVAFSRNLYRWSPQIRQEDGFLRLVWGLGTRAVERVGVDYPRLVALSHPQLRPEFAPKLIRRYSQQYVDVINLKANRFETLSIHQVLNRKYPLLRYIAQIDQGGFLMPIRSNIADQQISQVVITFDGLLQRTAFAEHMRRMLHILETHYHTPVDMEFAIYVRDPHSLTPQVDIAILQCRPQSHSEDEEAHLPEEIAPEDIIFSTRRMIPHGRVRDIRYVLFVVPERYYALPTAAERSELGRAIGRLNNLLAEETFICIGPGRWGTRNPDLGVNIRYSEIYNTRALIELAGGKFDTTPEPSFGTHFFQDLIEAKIYPLAIDLNDEDVIFNHDFFYNTPNCLASYCPEDADLEDCLRLIEVSSYRPEHHLELIMDSNAGQAVAILVPDA